MKKSSDVTVEVDMYQWAEHLTMEAIGQSALRSGLWPVNEPDTWSAAFGVRFGAIEGEDHELSR
jgi:hypothetical protein